MGFVCTCKESDIILFYQNFKLTLQIWHYNQPQPNHVPITRNIREKIKMHAMQNAVWVLKVKGMMIQEHIC